MSQKELASSTPVLLLVGVNAQLRKFFENFGDVMEIPFTADLPSDGFMQQFKCVVFGGGGDIPHDLYAEEEGEHIRTTTYGMDRTLFEIDVHDAAVRSGVPVVGICRGAQLLCTLAGGKLVQHVTGHTVAHGIRVLDQDTGEWSTELLRSSSTHHQMMMPFRLPEDKYLIIGKSAMFLSKRYERGPNAEDYTEKDMPCEPEIVYFKENNALAIQGHPEYTFQCSPSYIQYCIKLINKHTSI